MVNRPSDILPQTLIDELLRLGRLDRDWCEWTSLGGERYKATCKHRTWLAKLSGSGADIFGLWALSIWLIDGPKIFRPTAAQCEALENVEVNLTLDEYAQPFPAVLIDLPAGRYAPFTSVMCHKSGRMISGQLFSDRHSEDICTTVAPTGRPIEASIQQFDEGCREHSLTAPKILRVGLNACLALANFGCHKDYLLPKEVESDRRLAREQATPRGERARRRLEVAAEVLTLDREVVLHRTESSREPGEPTGREVGTHWRRGHWAMQAHGPNHSLRKRIFRPPVLVRADKVTEWTYTTTYRT